MKHLKTLSFATIFFCLAPVLSAQFRFAPEYRLGVCQDDIKCSMDFEQIELPELNAEQDKVLNIYEDSKGYIWIRWSVSDCMRFDGNEFVQVDMEGYSKPHFTRTVVHDVAEDKGGSHWIGTKTSLMYYDNQNKTVRFLLKQYMANTNSKYERAIFNIEKTSTRHLLLGTPAGLLLYNPASDSVEARMNFTKYQVDASSTTNHVRHTTADPNDSMLYWFTSRSGFYRLDLRDRSIKRYNTPHYSKERWEYFSFRYNVPVGDRLFTNVMYNYLMDFNTRTEQWEEVGAWADVNSHGIVLTDIKPIENKYLILSTLQTGLFLIDPVRKEYYPLDYTVEGKRLRHPEFWSFCVDKNGYLWTSLRQGILRSREPVVHKPPPKLQVELQAFEVGGKEIDYSRIKNNRITLGGGERSIKLKYAFINPDPSVKWSTSYRLKGYSETWMPADRDRWVEFNDLGAGIYTLEIKMEGRGEEIQSAGMEIQVTASWFEKPSIWVGGLACLIALFGGIKIVDQFLVGRKQRTRIKLDHRMRALQSKALKSQINPQFIFIILERIQKLIEENDLDNALFYLNQFSGFVRKVLTHSNEKEISLEEEIELSKRYLELERLRFVQTFKYILEVDASTDTSFVQVPPLFLQPFLENSIWKGLTYQEGERRLKIMVKNEADQIRCIIEDNGIRPPELKDTGLPFIVQIHEIMEDGKQVGTRAEFIIEI